MYRPAQHVPLFLVASYEIRNVVHMPETKFEWEKIKKLIPKLEKPFIAFHLKKKVRIWTLLHQWFIIIWIWFLRVFHITARRYSALEALPNKIISTDNEYNEAIDNLHCIVYLSSRMINFPFTPERRMSLNCLIHQWTTHKC